MLNLNTVGQAIIDGKVEVEALLEQNGYAKFTWKEDNKVANLIIQWGYAKSRVNITLPTAMTMQSITGIHMGSTGSVNIVVKSKDILHFVDNYSSAVNVLWFAIGT